MDEIAAVDSVLAETPGNLRYGDNLAEFKAELRKSK